MDLFTFIFLSGMGMIFLIIGLLIWKKEKITLIHDYHYTKVKDKDKKAYTAMMGKGICLMGIGIIFTAIINCFSNYGWYAFGVGFIGGFILIIIAQKRYNGGFF